jgi:hypothetical protein
MGKSRRRTGVSDQLAAGIVDHTNAAIVDGRILSSARVHRRIVDNSSAMSVAGKLKVRLRVTTKKVEIYSDLRDVRARFTFNRAGRR